jgi:hypothetical protein
MLFIVLAALHLSVNADPPEAVPCVYRIDPRPVAKTPRFLGVNVEVMREAERSNLWDWLADSGAGMIRLPHPDTNLRNRDPAADALFLSIRTQPAFDAFRAGLLADPGNPAREKRYRFAEEVPWLGNLDAIMPKLKRIGVEPLFSIAYAPGWFERPLLAAPDDDGIDWGAAASAYEYTFACVWHFASHFGVTRYMLLNEPSGDDGTIRQVGVLARFSRLALEDVRGRLADAGTAQALTLSGPATYLHGEAYWPRVAPHVDFYDVHLYEPDASVFSRKLSRALMCARPSGKRTMITEFNRVGGPMAPEESLFAIKPSLQVAGLLAAVLSSARSGDPGIEAALLYQFQFPATHRNFKSLVYGDMNWVDWSGRDRPLRARADTPAPPFEAQQLRFATPAYAMFRMAARCTPGAGRAEDGYDVLEWGEANLGVAAVRDPVGHRNVYAAQEENAYYANGGGGSRLRTLAVRAGNRLVALVANPEPVTVKSVGFDIAPLDATYAAAIVRETSALRHDEVIAQHPVVGGRIALDLPPHSLTQLIFVQEALSRIEDLTLEETTATPGDSAALGLLETTRLRARGRIGQTGFDLSDLNVIWRSSDPDAIRVGQNGLVQNIRDSETPVAITARTPGGTEAKHWINGKRPGRERERAPAPVEGNTK